MDTSNIIALIAPTITVFSIVLAVERDANSRFINMFNEIYNHTFALRNKVSRMTQRIENRDFFYELDTIFAYQEVEEAVLDYLTEMESFFSYVSGHYMARRSFNKLASMSFYQRIMVLYPYICRKSKRINNPDMFPNYVKALRMMHKMKKITNQLPKKTIKCYVGIRSSDATIAGEYFQEDICMFSSKDETGFFQIRPNQNIDSSEILPYYFMQSDRLVLQDMECQFVFYNQAIAYNYPPYILERSPFTNNRETLAFLNNKLTIKKWFVECGIPTMPYETFYGRDILYSKIASHFPDTDTFVIQSPHGGGGIGTFLVNQCNFSEVSKLIQPFQQYLVSPYIKHSISLNTHVFIAEKQTVLSPGSIQISELIQNQICYRGADFIEFRMLPAAIKERIKQLSLKIAKLLREEKYLGVAGIDFVLDGKGQVFCMEINPRFQASTYLLDKYLQENVKDENLKQASSSFELNEMAFAGSINSQLCFEDEIDYSCYYYYSDGMNESYFKKMYYILHEGGAEILLDGLNPYLSDHRINDNSYLFRAVFPHAICKISPDTTLWINDNIKIVSKPKDTLSLKIALLNQGARLTGDCDGIKRGVYESIDIEVLPGSNIKEKISVNCAVGIHLTRYSPYDIRCSGQSAELYYFDEKITDIKVETDKLKDFSQSERNILYLATDRLRIKMLSGCEYKNIGKGCRFCNLPISKNKFCLDDIYNALTHLKEEDINFRHILIGGGTCLSPYIWNDIIALCEKLKSDDFYKDKPITLMSVLPPKDLMPELKLAGIEEVAFNLEVANEDLALNLMPGKRRQGKDAYYEIFRKAVEIFGTGKVRSSLLVGLDREAEIYSEVLTLCNLGVLPCLSSFRALPGSDFEGDLSPSNHYLTTIHDTVLALLDNITGDIHSIGPECIDCRNNMLGL